MFQILPLGLCSLQEDVVHASVDDIERRLREITVSDMSGKDDKESILLLSEKDIAVWIMVASASVAEYQHDLRAKEHNARWRLALLTNKKVFMGNIFDPRYLHFSMFSYRMLHLIVALNHVNGSE